MSRKKRKIIKQVLLAGTVVILVAATALFWRYRINTEQADIKTKPEVELSADTTSYAEIYAPDPLTEPRSYNGGTYVYNKDMMNILVLGIDKNEPFRKRYDPGNAGQSDFIMLASVNRNTGETVFLQIHRNTMTDIDYFNFSGDIINSEFAQITLQYAYGIGGTHSARAMERTVSELLNGIRIDGYLVLNMSGIPEVVDYLGGVDVEVTGDMTHVDPAFVSGAKLHMNGEQLLKYVRYRDTDEFDSASARMQRHGDFIRSFMGKFRSVDANTIVSMLDKYLNVYVSTDLKESSLKAFSGAGVEHGTVISIPGEVRMGEIYEEFYPDSDGIDNIIYNNYFIRTDKE